MRPTDPIRRHPSSVRRLAFAGVALLTLVALAAAPAFAKEFEEARLDAPIPMGTPGGTEILVGVMVTAVGEDGTMVPIEGTPIYLRLFGRDGSSTRAAGAADRTPGHYTMRIAIPSGGARRIEIGVHGSSDLQMMVKDETLVFGGITAKTAQLAPALAPAMTPFARASAPAVAVAPAVALVRAAAPAVPAWPIALALGALALAAGVGVARIRTRRSAQARVAAAAPSPGSRGASGV